MSRKPKRRCRCVADKTRVGPLTESFRGPPKRRRWKTSSQVFHYREADDAYFWHWADQRMLLKKEDQ